MSYLIVNPDDTIADIVEINPGGGVFISESDMEVVAVHPHGHTCFKYVAGALAEDTTLAAQFDFERRKGMAVVEAKESQLQALIDAQAGPVIDAIIAAKDGTELDAAKLLMT